MQAPSSRPGPTPDAFERDLRGVIDGYFRDRGLTRFDDGRLRRKSVILLLVWAGLYAATLLAPMAPGWRLLLAILWGAASALVAFNIPHDATHGATSADARVNRRWSRVFNLVGLNRYTWWLKHDRAHHGYTNVLGWDPDIDAWPLLRYSPADKRLAVHRFQHLYAPLAYLLLGLFFVFWIDFKLFFDRRLARQQNVTHPVRELAILVGTKALYLGYALVLPMVVLDLPATTVLLGFLIVHGVVGILSALVLLPSHCMEWATFVPAAERDLAPTRWVRHQLAATLDFAPESRVANYLLGGFNTNAIHHLFPRICHVHYGALTRLLAERCRAHGVPYHAVSLPRAVVSHFRFLKAMGRGDGAERVA